MADDITPDKTEGHAEDEEGASRFESPESPEPEPGDSALSEDSAEHVAQEPVAEPGPTEPESVTPPAGPDLPSWFDSGPREFSTEPGSDASAEESADDALGNTSPVAAITGEEIAGAHGLGAPDATGEAGITPPVDPASQQMTQLLPNVGASDVVLAPQVGPLVTVGSRVVVVVSRGPSPIPPTAFVTMPFLLGQMQDDALAKLQETGLSAQVFSDYSVAPRGEVIGQLPQVGDSPPTGSETVVLVSGGPAPAAALTIPLPNVVGLPEADAIMKLQVAGLSPQIVRDYNGTVPVGLVADQLPNDHAVAEPPREKRKLGLWWLWLLLAVAVLVAIGGGVYYYLNRTAIVPSVVGLPQAQAEQAIAAAGFYIGSVSTTQTISASQVGRVTTQTPAPNTTLKLTDSINIVVSGGQLLFSVPDVVGKPQEDAKSEIMAAKLQVSVTQSYSPTVTVGAVMSQSPAAAQKVPSGTTVGVVVSLGLQNVDVPSVISQSKTAAANSLKAQNLGSLALVVPSLSYAKDLAFAQFPIAGTAVPPGRIVGFLVSSGLPSSGSTSTVSVPAVIGQAQKKAQQALTSAKLGTASIALWSGTNRPAGEVVGELPEAGILVPKNSKVILFVSNGK